MTGRLISPFQPFLSSPSPHAPSLTHHQNNLEPRSAPHSITQLLGEQSWLIYIDCYGPFSISGTPEQKEKEKSPSLLIHQTSTCQTLAQENNHPFLLFPPPHPILFAFSSTNNCRVPNSQEGAVICFSSAFSNNALNTR